MLIERDKAFLFAAIYEIFEIFYSLSKIRMVMVWG